MTSSAPSSSSAPGRAVAGPPTPTRWVGWILFAATMMVLLGALHAIAGLLALLNDQYYQVGKNDLTVHASYTVWGWIHLIVGVVVVAAAVALVSGRTWGRVVGVAVAGVSVLLNVGFLAASPTYAAILITIDVLVIWAITVHGSEITSAL